MLPIVKGAIERNLVALDRIQGGMDDAVREASSGYRVQKPSDDPANAAPIVSAHSSISRVSAVEKNLDTVNAEVTSAEGALETAIRLLDRASVLASEGANSPTLVDRTSLAQEVGGLLETVVALSRTSSGDRFIFSGDLDSQPLYEYDDAAPSGVTQLASTAATRLVEGADGTLLAPALTASEIFDSRDSAGQPTATNVFVALRQLQQALRQNDAAGVTQVAGAIDAASAHLNRQLAHYGTIQNAVEQASEIAVKFRLTEQNRLGKLRDADLAGAALSMSQAQINQQAALAATEKTLGQSLFDFLA
jgi:flagellar hook-associated protein 3 FlgL